MPKVSVANTLNVCEPAGTFENVMVPDEHATGVSASSWHVMLAKPPPEPSSAVNSNMGESSLDGFGGLFVIVTTGPVASTVHVLIAGLGSVVQALFVARTENVCEPEGKDTKSYGELHDAKLLPSSLHSNVAPAGVELNANDPDRPLILPSAGPLVIVVSGAVVSIVHV